MKRLAPLLLAALVWGTAAHAESQRAVAARTLFNQGRDAEALALARRDLHNEKAHAENNWIAGLASWRMGEMAQAYEFFAAAADNENFALHNRAAAAFWAGRTALRLDRPAEFTQRMYQAMGFQPISYYGLLAAAALGVDDFNDLLSPMAPTADAALDYRRARILWRTRGHIDLAGLYPIPEWHPPQGFKTSAALVFAVMRQESGFNTRARNPQTQAQGAMQILPSTARYLRRMQPNLVARTASPGVRDTSMGDAYLRYLADLDHVKGNLFYLLAAYNAGPGRLAEWQQKTNYMNDPLLFIEAIPSGETRHFIEEVSSAYWIYRMRLDGQVHNIMPLVEGEWPLIDAQAPTQSELPHANR